MCCHISFDMLEDQLHDQVGCECGLADDESAGERPHACCVCRAVVRRSPAFCSMLAANLITQLIFKHLAQHLPAHKTKIVRKTMGPGLVGIPRSGRAFPSDFCFWAAKLRSRCLMITRLNFKLGGQNVPAQTGSNAGLHLILQR